MSHPRNNSHPNTADSVHASVSARLRWLIVLLGVVIVLCLVFVALHASAPTSATTAYAWVAERAQWRKDIVDRNGTILATNLTSYDLVLNPRRTIQSNNLSATAALYSDIVKRFNLHALVSPETLIHVIQSSADKQYKRVAKNISPEVKYQIEQILMNQDRNWYFQAQQKRFQPQGSVFANVVGLVSNDGQGQTGIERQYNTQLRAAHTSQPEPLVLSLDSDMQIVAHSYLHKAVINTVSGAGAAIVLDAQTGEILVNSVYPTVDPNNRVGLDVNNLDNRIFTKQFEPGSTVKPLALASVLSDYPLQRVIDIGPGFIDLNQHRIEDTHISNTPLLTVFDVVVQSSNVGISKIVAKADTTQLLRVMRQFGFGYTTEVRFPNEKSGYIRILKRMQPIEQANMAFGYGIEVTMAQLASAYQVIANQGVRMPLTLLKQDANQLPQGTQVLNSKTAQDLMYALEGVVHDAHGTGKRARIAGYRVAGKTGTARRYSRTTKTYGETHRVLFIGMVPSESPQFVIAVMLDKPQVDHRSGGFLAAPVFSAIGEELLRMRGIAPSEVPSFARMRSL